MLLPFHVQTHIAKNFNSGRADISLRIVYVELRGHEAHCSAFQDDNSFELLK